MGALLWVTLVICCGTPSSQILKCSLAVSTGSARGRPSFWTTRASTVTTGTSTCNENCGLSDAFGLGGGGGSSVSFFLGTAMVLLSPVGPPASGGIWFCWDWLACCRAADWSGLGD